MRMLAAACCTIAMVGCMVGPDFQTPPAPEVNRFTAKPLPKKTTGVAHAKKSASHAQYLLPNRDVQSEWWTLFHSKELNQLICCGLANSPNLQAAKAAVIKAQEIWRAQLGTLMLPAIDGQFDATRQRSVTILPGATDPFRGSNLLASIFNQFTLQGNFYYALDIFGGSRRELEGYCAQVEYQQFQLEAAYLNLTTSIVTTAFTIASLQKQIEATEAIIHLQQEGLDIVKKQFTLGAASGAEVLLQETQVAQTRTTLPPLKLSLAKSNDALAALVGQFPSTMKPLRLNLDALHLPEKLPVSLPACLVRQRPDVRAQEALLHYASSQVGVATANLFPKIALTGSYGWTSNDLHKLITPQASLWNYGVGILQPIFHGGALLAERRAAMAAYDQACAVYRETILLAFQNVADSLESIQHDAEAYRAQVYAETVARKSLQLTEKQYRLGGISYLTLLVAQRAYQQAVINRIQAQATRYADTVNLFQSLGGGWWNREPLCERRIIL